MRNRHNIFTVRFRAPASTGLQNMFDGPVFVLKLVHTKMGDPRIFLFFQVDDIYKIIIEISF